MPNDQELVLRARGGDPRAREAIARRVYEPVYAVCRRLRGEPEAAEAAQETFVQILESLDRFDTDRPLVPWACGIARNVCRTDRRRERRTRRVELPGDRAIDAAQPMGGGRDHELDAPALVAANEDRALLREAFTRLSPDQRRVISGRLLEGQSSREVGATLSLSEGAVRVRLHRALEALRGHVAALRGRDPDEAAPGWPDGEEADAEGASS